MSTHQMLLAFHFLCVAMGIGFSASNFVNVRLALAQAGDAAKAFGSGLGLQRRTIARFGDGVITLIWISGGLLLWNRGMEGLSSAFHVKIMFVVLLTVFHGLGRATGERMRRSGNAVYLPRLGWFIFASWASAVFALICAVLTFAA